MNTVTGSENLQNSTKKKAIKLLGIGINKTNVAHELGISRDTIYVWLKDEDFRSAINIEIDTDTKLLSKRLALLDIRAINAIERALEW